MKNREQWVSRLGFILAAAGSAVGLGNIWKFPSMAGENGGAAFTLIYLICIFVVGLPIVIAEFVIGRKTQLSPVGAFNLSSQLDINVTKREKNIDQNAAAFILQGAIDFLNN